MVIKPNDLNEGCIKLRFPGWGQLVPGAVGLELRGQAVPRPFRKALELELDAVLGGRSDTDFLLESGRQTAKSCLNRSWTTYPSRT
jgi:hypothetical protein